MIIIHSPGHMGTRWISENLNSLGKIISIHGDQLVKKFDKRYLNYESLIEIGTIFKKENKLIFIHAPIFLSEKEYYKFKDKVEFVFLTRNPAKRTNTIITHFLMYYFFNNKAGFFAQKQTSFFKTKINLNEIFDVLKDDIDRVGQLYLKKKYLYYFFYLMFSIKSSIINTFFRNKIDTLDKSFILKNKTFLSFIITNLFLHGVQSSFQNDKQIINLKAKFFTFEKITDSKKEFLRLLKIIDSDYEEKDINDDTFFQKKGSLHKSNTGNEFWPDSFKCIFNKHKRLDSKLRDFYSKQEYF